MGRGLFDALARQASMKHSRRTALAMALAGLLLRQEPLNASAKRNGNGQGQARRRNKRRQRNKGPDTCISTIGQICSIFGTLCCEPGACTELNADPLFTFCQWPCANDSECVDIFGMGSACLVDLELCLGIGGKCCRFPN